MGFGGAKAPPNLVIGEDRDISELIDQFWPATIDGLTVGAIYALVALGYTLVYGVLRLINFAHSEVFMVGTFTSLFAVQAMVERGSTGETGLALVAVLVVAMLAGMAGSAATALVLERAAYRPLRRSGSTRLAALITAIGASLVLQELFAWWRDRDPEAMPRIMEKKTVFTLFGGDVRTDKLLIVVAAVVMMLLLDRFVGATRLGRGIRAVAQDPETATLMGVNIDRVIAVTFLLGGLMAGGAATFYMLTFELTRFNVGFLLGVKAFTAAVLGGIGNLRGALLGGFSLGLIENWGGAWFGSQWKDVIAFVVLVAVLMVRPTGLLGESLSKARA